MKLTPCQVWSAFARGSLHSFTYFITVTAEVSQTGRRALRRRFPHEADGGQSSITNKDRKWHSSSPASVNGCLFNPSRQWEGSPSTLALVAWVALATLRVTAWARSSPRFTLSAMCAARPGGPLRSGRVTWQSLTDMGKMACWAGLPCGHGAWTSPFHKFMPQKE